jgi:hypothetical protein
LGETTDFWFTANINKRIAYCLATLALCPFFHYLAPSQKAIMFDKIFGRGKKKTEPVQEPDISFGRYSDNNKPLAKINRWTDADSFFKQKKYPESLDAFFDYLRDDIVENVVYERNGREGKFEVYQGSKIVRGVFNSEHLSAEVTLAKMPQPSTPVMRRLLESNFSLYYSRFALDNDRLCMRFDSSIEGASPGKLYYGMKELATKADKQDDLLVQDFTSLQVSDSGHIAVLSQQEKETRYEYLQRWLKQTLDTIASLDADKLSGGIAYMLLSLAYRIDYLLVPEGRLLRQLEQTAGIYFRKDERPVAEKNRDMIEEYKKLQAWAKEDVFNDLIRSKYTFSIVAPQNYKTVTDSVHGAIQNMTWYRDNSHHFIATQVMEYGLAFCQYSYSLPKVISELFNVYMRVNYGDYYRDMGYKTIYYEASLNRFNTKAIIDKIKSIQEKWKDKYPLMDFKVQNLRFDNLVNFDHTFCTEMEFLIIDVK